MMKLSIYTWDLAQAHWVSIPCLLQDTSHITALGKSIKLFLQKYNNEISGFQSWRKFQVIKAFLKLKPLQLVWADKIFKKQWKKFFKNKWVLRDFSFLDLQFWKIALYNKIINHERQKNKKLSQKSYSKISAK